MTNKTTSSQWSKDELPASLIDYLDAKERVGSDWAPRTRDEYARRITKLRTQFALSGRAFTPIEIAREFKAQVEAKALSKGSARLFRSACFFWLGEEAQILRDQGASFSEHAEAYSAIMAVATSELPAKTERSSSKRPKEFPQEALRMVENYVRDHPRSNASAALLVFLRANLLVGLRPDEWFGQTGLGARLYTEPTREYRKTAGGRLMTTPMLVVQNGKSSRGRANGEFRELLLYGLTDADYRSLEACSQLVAARAEKAGPSAHKGALVHGFLNQLNKTLQRVLKHQGYKGPSLSVYCTRHQAVANAKASGMTDKEVAAMFGHSSVTTARRHYGLRMNAWGRTSFRPSPEAIAAIRGIHNRLSSPTLPEPVAEHWIAQLGDRVVDRPE